MNRFGKMLTALSAGLTMAGLLAMPALAWSDDLAGRPANLQAGGDLGYYVWHDEAGLHLRTTGPGPRHTFHAVLETPGEFRDVRLVRLEGDDGFLVRDGGHVLDIHFETWDGIDGVDFRIEGGPGMRLILHRDGTLSSTDEIYLGADGSHPDRNPFVEWR